MNSVIAWVAISEVKEVDHKNSFANASKVTNKGLKFTR